LIMAAAPQVSRRPRGKDDEHHRRCRQCAAPGTASPSEKFQKKTAGPIRSSHHAFLAACCGSPLTEGEIK
jgi:hypothetical protein